MNDYLQRTPFFRVLLPFVAGIVVASSAPGLTPGWIYLTLFILFVLSEFLIRKTSIPIDCRMGVIFSAIFLTAGFILQSAHNNPVKLPSGEVYKVFLLERPVEREKSFRVEAMLTVVFQRDSLFDVREKILVYLRKDDRIKMLAPGSLIVFNKLPEEIKNEGNPFEFDYKKFLLQKNIRYQVFLDSSSWKFNGMDSVFRMMVFAEKVRDYLLDIYRRSGIIGNELDVLSALTFGYKKNLDPEIRQVFANTGAAHVLSVSGLHVGIVYIIFNFLFGFMRRRRTLRLLFLFLAILLLWFFAFVTGLSPPVQRSALMFSVVLTGENLKRPSNIFNTLYISAFIILVTDPDLLSDVGLQLSYAAMAGIVYFQPKLKLLWQPRFKAVVYCWDLFTVSVAAQMMTFPLTCYYFRQFPVYFWLSNFVVVPAAFILLCLGFLILITSPVTLLSGLFSGITCFLLKQLLWLLDLIENLPGAIISGLNFSGLSMALTFGMLVFLMVFIESRKYFFFRCTICAMILFLLSGALEKIRQNSGTSIIAYKYKDPVINLIMGRNNYIIAPSGVIESGFPEREVQAVANRLRLNDRILIPLESDYTDSLVIKRKHQILFAGKVLGFTRPQDTSELINMDIWITLDPLKTMIKEAKDIQIVSYSGNSSGKSGYKNVHYVKTQGAWHYQVKRRDPGKNKDGE